MNGLKVFLLMVTLMALFGLIGYLMGGSSGLAIALAVAIVMNFVSYWYSDRFVLRLYRGRQVEETDHPRLYGTVKRVATKAMMPLPKVYIVPSKAPNAFATGRNADHAAVAATEGLLELLSDDELEGVIGHEMAHIQNRDMLVGTIAATFVGAIGILAAIARWGAIFGGYSRDNNRGGGVALLITALLAPLMAVVLQAAISRQREYEADAEEARISGHYEGLANALMKLHRSPVRMNLDQRPATANLMIVNPISGRGITKLFSTHPPMEKRVERLRKLATRSGYEGL